ncbi:hypothetical protein ACFSL6_12390 [Paenibacillus thailandensis]|uniref:hypothetical protein n=1 Tax=Paenibacillus thailandensis TaxID=393250 RepID=UPI00363D514F
MGTITRRLRALRRMDRNLPDRRIGVKHGANDSYGPKQSRRTRLTAGSERRTAAACGKLSFIPLGGADHEQ